MKWKEFKENTDSFTNDDDEIAGTIWTKEDILAEFETMDYDFDLDDQVVDDILKDIHENQDCDYCINWDLIRCNIQDYININNLIKKGT